MWTVIFWKRTAERCFTQFVIAVFATASGMEKIIQSGEQIQWRERAYIGLIQAGTTLGVCLLGAQIGDKTSPSLLPSPPEPPLDSEGHVDPERV